MKNYAKFLPLFIIVITLCFSKTANAQAPQKFSFGLNAGVANKKYQSFAAGLDMRFLFNISKQLSIPLTIGYTVIKEKNYHYAEEFFPLKIGVKGFFSETGIGYYGMLEAGIVAMPGYVGFNSIPKVFSPAIGYGWKNRVDLAVKYEDYAGGPGFTGLRLGYWF